MLIHDRFPDTERNSDAQTGGFDKALLSLGLGSLDANDLSELRNLYSGSYVEPRLEDAATEGISRIIKGKIDKAVQLRTGSRQYEPAEVYVIDSYDPKTYQSHLESTYADDSIHLPEFPESYGNNTVHYKEMAVFRIQLEKQFSIVVEPRYYIGHSWDVGNVTSNTKESFTMPPNLVQSVLFAIIMEKVNPKRQFKVFWILDSGSGE